MQKQNFINRKYDKKTFLKEVRFQEERCFLYFYIVASLKGFRDSLF